MYLRQIREILDPIDTDRRHLFIHWPNVWQSGRHCANKGATRSVQSRPRIDSKADKQTEKERKVERERGERRTTHLTKLNKAQRFHCLMSGAPQAT